MRTRGDWLHLRSANLEMCGHWLRWWRRRWRCRRWRCRRWRCRRRRCLRGVLGRPELLSRLPATSVAICGVGGVQCATCIAGESCANGLCAPMSNKRVGEACFGDSDCASLGAAAFCKLSTSSGNASYVGGYCTLRCQTAAGQCPSGSSCVNLEPRYGETDRFCWDDCTASDPCRSPGYSCYQLTNGNGCWLSPLPTPDSGPPAQRVGSSCVLDVDCTPLPMGTACTQISA